MKAIVYKSFQVSFILLVAISILTLTRSLNNDVKKIDRLSLQLSTLVTVIASFHYYLMLNRDQNPVIYRYLDWFFTTPILLIDFCIIYGIRDISFIAEILLYNAIMLILGFMGELKIISMTVSMLVGFIPFGIMFRKLYYKIKNTESEHSLVNEKNRIKFFYIFVGLWSMYGFTHIYPSKQIRDIFYNVLDIITKGVFGLFIYKKTFLRNI